MRQTVILAALCLALVPLPASAQAPTSTVADPVQPKPMLRLTEAQHRQVADAISGEDTLEKLPPDFQPTIGAKAPVQAKLATHPLPRPLVYAIPALKEYYYAQLADRILIIDPMSGTVADIVTR